MGKQKNIKSGMRVVLTTIILFAASVPTFAGWRIVIDRNCIATVGANLASQKLIVDSTTGGWTPSPRKNRRWNSTP